MKALEQLEQRRLLSAGEIDTAFGVGGTLAVGGTFGQPVPAVIAIGSENKFLLMLNGRQLQRRSADGSLDATFGVNGTAEELIGDVRDVKVAADGKIVVAGSNAVARYNADGTPDSGFGIGGLVDVAAVVGDDVGVFQILVRADGKVVLLDWFGGHVYRLTAAGTLDSFFQPFQYARSETFENDPGTVNAGFIALAPDGAVILGGKDLVHNGNRFDCVRLTDSGALDTTFGIGGYFNGINGRSFLVQPDGKILAAWRDTVRDNLDTLHIRRITADGQIDSAYQTGIWFGNRIAGEAQFAVQDDGKVIVYTHTALARLNADGTLDDSFSRISTRYHDGAIGIRGVAVEDDGDLIVATARDITRQGELHRLHGEDAPAGSIGMVGSTLTITGTDDVDGFYVETNADDIFVRRRFGFGRFFAAGDVSGMNISLGGGNDWLLLYQVDLPATIAGAEGDDTLIGGEGDDSISGGGGRDHLFGRGGNDTLLGGASKDILFGGDGHDLLIGDGGNDFFRGGAGADTMHGGAGFDTFISWGDNAPDHIIGGRNTDWAVHDASDILESIENELLVT